MPARRRLLEGMSMSAPIFEAEMSMGSMRLFDSEPVRRRLTESNDMSMSTPIFEAEMSIGSMPLFDSEISSLSMPARRRLK